MPRFEHDGVAINYEVRGTGYPLLLIAPGGMNSCIAWWARAALDPLTVYADDYQLVAMDQRNAGASTGPLDVEDPWGSYAGDQVRLLDHLGIDRCHVLGCCIGCSHALGLIQRAPDRVTAPCWSSRSGSSTTTGSCSATCGASGATSWPTAAPTSTRRPSRRSAPACGRAGSS